ncbi:MAG: twin-arginine translocase TatA/TatE family subunit [Vicinamibacteria bacterium]|nr:twin-arginine translocase TatA/TatE family subunit [Vicinamibacteria bacterium]
MFGTLGGPEIFLILVIALIVFGPRKLPEIGKSVGNMMNEFRRASNEFRRTVEEEVEADRQRALPAPVPGPVVEPVPDTVPVGAPAPADAAAPAPAEEPPPAGADAPPAEPR